eukprot:599200_1
MSPKIGSPQQQHRGKQLEMIHLRRWMWIQTKCSLSRHHDVILGMFSCDSAVESKPVEAKMEHKEAEVDEAMGFIGGLMAANPEFGDSENIFGSRCIECRRSCDRNHECGGFTSDVHVTLC